jgi:uncharacterized low-complexity protein
MSKKSNVLKPVTAAVSMAFASTLSMAAIADTTENPFAAAELNSGYMVAEHHGKGDEGKCGEGKCGEGKGEEGKGEEGKGEEGKCGEGKGDEGKCGEGKCGES